MLRGKLDDLKFQAVDAPRLLRLRGKRRRKEAPREGADELAPVHHSITSLGRSSRPAESLPGNDTDFAPIPRTSPLSNGAPAIQPVLGFQSLPLISTR